MHQDILLAENCAKCHEKYLHLFLSHVKLLLLFDKMFTRKIIIYARYNRLKRMKTRQKTYSRVWRCLDFPFVGLIPKRVVAFLEIILRKRRLHGSIFY